jgi:hypothetical protein
VSLAPVALFAYNRPQHLDRVVASLLANPEAARTVLYAFSDAPRTPEQAPRVREVRERLAAIRGFAKVELVLRERNHGLSGSIVDGVSRLCAAHGRAIVVEDDIEVAPVFLRYMNEALERYRDDARVLAIGGYMFPVREKLPETFFFAVPDCWGWATWKRAWDLFEPDGAALLAEIRRRGLEREFDLGGAYPYVRMLENQAAGRVDSWAVRWYARAFLLGGLTLYPGRSVTRNIGMDGSGVNNLATSAYEVQLPATPVRLGEAPVSEDRQARERIAAFLRGAQGWRARVRQWLSGRLR